MDHEFNISTSLFFLSYNKGDNCADDAVKKQTNKQTQPF